MFSRGGSLGSDRRFRQMLNPIQARDIFSQLADAELDQLLELRRLIDAAIRCRDLRSEVMDQLGIEERAYFAFDGERVSW